MRQSGSAAATREAFAARAVAAGLSRSTAGFIEFASFVGTSGPFQPARAGANCVVFSAGSETSLRMSGRIGVALSGNSVPARTAMLRIVPKFRIHLVRCLLASKVCANNPRLTATGPTVNPG